jgi:hypothetical protein
MIKRDIDTLDAMIKRSQKQIQSDFDKWYNVMYGGGSNLTTSTTQVKQDDQPVSKPKDAWNSTPTTSTSSKALREIVPNLPQRSSVNDESE